MSALRDVAEKAGVSSATASRVLNGNAGVSEELRERVLTAAANVRYQPSIGKRNTDRIALMYTYSIKMDLSTPYEAACYDGMVDAMKASGFDLVITDVNRDRLEGEGMTQFFARKGLAGAIVRSTREQKDLVDDMVNAGIPVVLLGDHYEDANLSFCFSDSKQASREAVSYLVSLGHREIAFASCNHQDGDHADRFLAYQEVMKENDLYREDLIHLVPPYCSDGAQLARRMLCISNRPTAVFVADPMAAIGILCEAHRLGVRVPDDFSVVGFDDNDLRTMAVPRMTAVVQDSRQLGRDAFNMVADLIKAEEPTNKANRGSCWLEIHDSTAPPRGSNS